MEMCPKDGLFPKETWVLRSLLMISGVSPRKSGFFLFWCLGPSASHGVVLVQDQAPTHMGCFRCWGQQFLGLVGSHLRGNNTLGCRQRCELLGTGVRGHLVFPPQCGVLLAPSPILSLLAALGDPMCLAQLPIPTPRGPPTPWQVQCWAGRLQQRAKPILG